MQWDVVWQGINTNFAAGVIGGLVVLLGVILERQLANRSDDRRSRQQAAALLARDVFMLRDAVLSRAGAKGDFDIWPLRSQITAARFYFGADELAPLEVLVDKAGELRRWLRAGLGGTASMRGSAIGDEVVDEAELRGEAARRIFDRHAQQIIDLLYGDMVSTSSATFTPPKYPNLDTLTGQDPDPVAS